MHVIPKLSLSSEDSKKKLTIVLFIVISLAFLGCAGMSDTEQRTLSGNAMGAAAGTVVGAIAGNAGWGAAIGAATGAAGGYLYDRNQKAKEETYNRGYLTGSNDKIMSGDNYL